jgi:undecaprenyl diphosphate synthase
VRIQFVGELQELPPDILDLCNQISAKGTGNFVITAAIGYDPVADARKITSGNISDNKVFDPTGITRPSQRNIDLVFRSGGELRASGFFPLQTLYSEWVYTPTLFPDVTIDDINNAISDFLQRKRNFGQ